LPLPRFVDYSLRFIAPISLGLALYFHYQSVQERVPTFYVGPTRARIVDTSIPAPPQMQVLYKGKDLNANVSAAVVYFWNDGRLPIKAEDVLEPLTIELDPTCEIIDARILKVSRAVTKFAKGEISDTARNSLPVSFGILERNDGAVLQIIYSGDPDTTLSLRGIIVGAGSPVRLAPGAPEREELARTRTILLRAFTIMSVLASGIFAWYFDARHIGEAVHRPRLRTFVGIALWLALVVSTALVGRSIFDRPAPVPQSISLKQ
jgi:hypothetical protein